MTAKLSSAHLPGRVRGFQSMRKPYEKPTVTKLTPEQVKLKLVAHASGGDQGPEQVWVERVGGFLRSGCIRARRPSDGFVDSTGA